MRKTKSEAQADATTTDTTTNSPTSSRSSVWRRLSLVRENPNEAQADVTRVDTTTTTAPTPSPEMVALRLVRACPGATISANAVGVFYRGIFLRPMYTAECDTAPTSMHIDATHEVNSKVNSVRPIHEDAGRQLEGVIHRLASRMTPPCSIDATTHEDANSGTLTSPTSTMSMSIDSIREEATVGPPAPADFSPETLSARNTEAELFVTPEVQELLRRSPLFLCRGITALPS